MQKIPFKGIAVGCFALFFLVLVRTAVTVGRCRYYSMNIRTAVLGDIWVYLGVAALLIGFLMLAIRALVGNQKL